MHRNTYLNAPSLLAPSLAFREHPRLFTAGVLAGTEGYLESSATGWLAGLNAARAARGLPPVVPPERSMLGGLVRYLSSANPEGFQPMNANWGLVPDVEVLYTQEDADAQRDPQLERAVELLTSVEGD